MLRNIPESVNLQMFPLYEREFLDKKEKGQKVIKKCQKKGNTTRISWILQQYNSIPNRPKNQTRSYHEGNLIIDS